MMRWWSPDAASGLGTVPCSSSVTAWPRFASCHAAESPAMPPPTTIVFIETPAQTAAGYGLAGGWQGALNTGHDDARQQACLRELRPRNPPAAARSARALL